MIGPLKELWVISLSSAPLSATLTASDADDTVSCTAEFYAPPEPTVQINTGDIWIGEDDAKAPLPDQVNTGEFWIGEDSPKAPHIGVNTGDFWIWSCRALDFGFCPWDPLYLGIDNYYFLTQANLSPGGDTLYITGGNKADGGKLEYDNLNIEYAVVDEYTLDGEFVQHILKPEDQATLSGHWSTGNRVCTGVAGEALMWASWYATADAFGRPCCVLRFWNRRDDDPAEDIRYNVGDRSGSNITYSTPSINPQFILTPEETLLGVAGGGVPAGNAVVKYNVPSGGDIGVDTNYMDVIQEPTDPLLLDVAGGVLIVSDDGRYFVFTGEGTQDPGKARTLIEFDIDLDVINTWSIPNVYAASLNGGMPHPMAVAANRFMGGEGADKLKVFELNANGTTTIVHEFDLQQIGAYEIISCMQSIKGLPGVSWFQRRYTSGDVPKTGIFMLSGTPDYP